MNQAFRLYSLLLGLAGFAAGGAGGAAPETASTSATIHARRIWDAAPHNAFTDLIRFRDRWFCVFREGQAHVSPDGAFRILTSPDGERWESAARIASPTGDLRDAKFSLMPDGRLMLCGAEAPHDKSAASIQSLAWFSSDGFDWGECQEIGDPGFWLWRVTWHRGIAYAVGYCGGEDRFVRLYASADGRRFTPLVDRLCDTGSPNEATLLFEGDTALCLLRREGDTRSGLLGVARPPFDEWEWKDTGKRLGGPNLLRLPDGRFVAATRLYDGGPRSSLCWLDPRDGRLTEFLRLPSGGDTSYAGLAAHEGRLWVSYYSSHEEKTAIYLARIPIGEMGARPTP